MIGVLAVYRYLDELTDAIEKVRDREDFADYEIYSPTSYHEIEHAARLDHKSPVKWFTLTGGMLGTITGFSLPLLMDADWPMVVGGKTAGIYSLPAYVIMGFELTILFGAIATIGGMLIMGRIPNPKTPVIDTRFTDDHFGIFVPRALIDGEQAKLLKELGAAEVKEIDLA
jgi:hypothetical protein